MNDFFIQVMQPSKRIFYGGKQNLTIHEIVCRNYTCCITSLILKAIVITIFSNKKVLQILYIFLSTIVNMILTRILYRVFYNMLVSY